MKKIILLIAIAFTAQLHAQYDSGSGITVKPGLRGGVNFTNFTQTDFNYKTDFYVGGFMAVKLTRFYTLQPEVTYSRQGAQGSGVIFNNNAQVFERRDFNVNIDYLSFAILNRFTFNDELDFHFGPTMDFQTRSNAVTNSDVDLAFIAGLGYTLPMGLVIEARVKKGIIDVLESNRFDNIGNNNTNLVFQLGLSYSFLMKGTTK